MSEQITPEQLQLNEAIALAAEVHTGQVRKMPDGRPYICHVLDVVNALPAELHTTRLVAALHDTVEDIAEEKREWLKDEIKRRFGSEVLAGVVAMTHVKPKGLTEEEEPADYLKYIEEKVLADPHAPLVKLADNYVNMKDRVTVFIAGVTDSEKARVKIHQYALSIALLTTKKR